MAERIRLAASPDSPGLARHFVADLLARWDYGHLIPDVVLMTSEIATNAVIHAGEPFSVGVEDLGNGVRVTVDDPVPALPTRRQATPVDSSGRGLQIVDALASASGASRNVGDGKSVWFEART